ncbi:MFS transporter [Kocuria massiliensis]|uniref:MFS transporter n=1 Tax=Kocuria massiliensis TaxID=1926282 RepID=UPI000A1C9974|nr:MFS transporter [Kocuria massiliensis]
MPSNSVHADQNETSSEQTGAGSPPADQRRKAVVSSFLGNFVEWFDYGAYSYLAVTIAAEFFPGDTDKSLFMTFALFAVSFLIRPFGAFFWGHWGDKYGRTQTLAWSIILMTGATFLIGCLPGASTIGMAAPIALLVLRLVQGFSAAGEYAGASALLSEFAPRGKRGRYAAIVPASTASGLLLGSLAATILYGLLEDSAMESWGWRLPFLVAGPLGLIGLYIRRKIDDTPAFHAHTTRQMEMVQRGQKPPSPTLQLVTKNFPELIQGFGIVLLNAVGFYVVLTFMPTYLSENLHYDAAASQLATTISLVTYIGFVFLTGRIADRIGRRNTLILASSTFLVLSIPAFMVMGTGHYVFVVAALVVMGAFLSLNDGALPSAVSELYPTAIRFSGFALVFNIGNALFGGPMSAVNTWLISTTGNTMWPAYILMGASLLALLAVLWSKDHSSVDIDDVDPTEPENRRREDASYGETGAS